MADREVQLGCGEKLELGIDDFLLEGVDTFRLKWADAKTGAQSGMHELKEDSVGICVA